MGLKKVNCSTAMYIVAAAVHIDDDENVGVVMWFTW